MIVTAIKTQPITPGSTNLIALLDTAISNLEENCVIAISSKIVSLCENRAIPIGHMDKESLIAAQADFYLPVTTGHYGYHFTITHNTLISAAGIDKSNGNGHYVLWPKDSQTTANQIRRYLQKRFMLSSVGVIITDSASYPLRLGTLGIVLAHSGFLALHSYIGEPDVFGQPLRVSRANISGGLGAAAVLQMGEGNEQTPLAVISDVPFVSFQDRDPNDDELAQITLSLEDDLFAPFLTKAAWQKGTKKRN